MKWKDLIVGKRYEFRAANLPGFDWLSFTLISKKYTGVHGGILTVVWDATGMRRDMINAMHYLRTGCFREMGS